MPTPIPEVRPGAPTELTETSNNQVPVPTELTELSDNQVVTPTELTEVANNQVVVPTELTEVSQLTPDAPTELTEVSNNQVVIPTELTEVANNQVVVPTDLTEVANNQVVVPTELTEVANNQVVVPTSLTEVALAPLPRTIEAILNMDFTAGSYALNGNSQSLLDIASYARAGTATFWNRRINNRGEYETFIDTDFVGSVTNLLTYSNNFSDSDWNKQDSTVQQDGDAFRLYDVGGSPTAFYIQQSVTVPASTDVNYSIEVKAGSKNYVLLYDNDRASGIQVDLRAGTIVRRTGSQLTYGESVEYLGDGWYRISLVRNSVGTSTIYRVYIADVPSTATYDGDGTGYILIRKAQASSGAKVKPYVETLGSSASETFAESPRLEYDPVTAQPLGYLSETSETNLITQSEDIDGSNWGSTAVSITTNGAFAPDGSQSMDFLGEDSTAASQHRVNQGGKSVTSGANYTGSFYAKQGVGDRYVRLLLFSSAGAFNSSATFDLDNGTVQSSGGTELVSAYIEDVGGGVYRCKVTATAASTETDAQILINLIDGADSSYDGDGVSGVYVWGVQLEQSNQASSYIPTESTSASRPADDLHVDLTLRDIDKITLYANANWNDTPQQGNNNRFSLSAGRDTSNRFVLYNRNQFAGGAFISESGATEFTAQSDIATDEFVKTTLTAERNNVTAYVNGESVNNDTDAVLPDVDHVGIGTNLDITNGTLNGHVKEARVYLALLTADEVSLL